MTAVGRENAVGWWYWPWWLPRLLTEVFQVKSPTFIIMLDCATCVTSPLPCWGCSTMFCRQGLQICKLFRNWIADGRDSLDARGCWPFLWERKMLDCCGVLNNFTVLKLMTWQPMWGICCNPCNNAMQCTSWTSCCFVLLGDISNGLQNIHMTFIIGIQSTPLYSTRIKSI
jgi:hypothetical protein